MVSLGRRFKVLHRDNFTCRYCGAAAPDVLLEVDHVVPRAAGGGNELTNLVTSCRDCNQGKRDRHIGADPSGVNVDQWADAMGDLEDRAIQVFRGQCEETSGLWDTLTGDWPDWGTSVELGRLILEHGYEPTRRALRVCAWQRRSLNLRAIEWILKRWQYEADALSR